MSVNGKCSIQFIDNCTSTHVNPRFLKFRIPNNDCFELTTLHYLSNKVTEKGTVQSKTGIWWQDKCLYYRPTNRVKENQNHKTIWLKSQGILWKKSH